MKTFSFIGTDKNAGKTTVLNFVYNNLKKKGAKLCLTSAGINGEEFDNLEGHKKPNITIHKNTFFVTSTDRLHGLHEFYKQIESFSPPEFRKHYILGKMTEDRNIVLEGPNEKNELIQLKKYIKEKISPDYLMIDGSVDRQFLGDPKVSDEFFFAILISKRKEQLKKAKDFIYSLSLKHCHKEEAAFIDKNVTNETKSLLFGKDKNIFYHGTKIPFLDTHLKEKCLKNKQTEIFLYLNGALSHSLSASLSRFKSLHIILDNFTQYQSISTKDELSKYFAPKLSVKHPIKLAKIFVREEADKELLALPKGIPVYNLFKDDVSGIKI